MRYISIKNFESYQHYKDRRPPWIKLHASVLEDYAFSCLHDASKAHLMLLWLLASKLGNRIPYDPEWIARQIGSSSPLDLETLVTQGFLHLEQDDSTTLAPSKQSAMPETEAERETETKRETATRSRAKRNGDNRHRTSETPALPAQTQQAGWVAVGVEWWVANVGEITHGHFGKVLKSAVERYGWEKVFAALQEYVDVQKNNGKVAKLQWFVESVANWVELASMPLTDDHGDLTKRGELWAGKAA